MTSATYTPVSQQAPGKRPREFSDFEWTADNAEQVTVILARYPETRRHSAIMPLLWLAQEQMGAATGSSWLPVPV
ncbi:MAG: hypothetical protein ACRYG4_01285, partial [Janthinobacterium lividum]